MIRDRIKAMVARNAPDAHAAEVRTKSLILNLIRNNFSKPTPVDEDSLNACEWGQADHWIYLDTATSIMHGGVVPLHYGQAIQNPEMARVIRDLGLRIVPVCDGPPRDPAGEKIIPKLRKAHPDNDLPIAG